MRSELVRRFLVWQTLLLWQGGFLFYAAVVVPIGSEVLGSDREQGFITQQVTIWLNRCGWLALAVLAWDVAAASQLRRARAIVLTVSVVILAVLVAYLHDKLGHMLDVEEHRIRDRRAFYSWHGVYLWLSALHWLMMMAMAVLTLQSWRKHDQSQASES